MIDHAIYNISLLSFKGKLPAHPRHKETEDNDLEKTLIEDYQDEDEGFNEYDENNGDSEHGEIDTQLADARAYPRPNPWRWLRRVSISCTWKCTKHHLLRKDYPQGCECNKFAWEKN